jgi:hypothetical protein
MVKILMMNALSFQPHLTLGVTTPKPEVGVADVIFSLFTDLERTWRLVLHCQRRLK